ncbi:MAG: sulfatase-like hydrolase/transferase [Planctomycetota bacterium]
MSIRNGRFLAHFAAERVPFERTRRLIFADVLAVPVLLSVACSVLLIERRYGLVHTGFLSTAVLTGWQLPIFLAATALVDAAVLSVLALAWTAACRVAGAGTRRHATGGVALLGLVVGLLNTLQYNVLTYLGDWMHLRAAVHTARGVSGTMPFFQQWLVSTAPMLAIIVALVAVGAALIVRLGRPIPDTAPVPFARPARRAAFLLVAALAVEVVICHAPGVPSGAIATSLRRTSLQRVLESGFAALTDWDDDGLGWLDTPADFAPFDATRSPFALDIPGDGIDSDGVGGDLPALIELDRTAAVGRVVSRPDVVLIVPCSLRADALTGGPDFGPPVMPYLAGLAQQGLHVDPAYSHCGHTISAIQQILSGQHARHTSSLVTDMKSAGYRVGVISTQDESFGATAAFTRMHEADYFADGRCDPAARVTSYSTASSLILPAKWAIHKTDEFLSQCDAREPVFLFVHVETCHFPYFHDSPDEIVPRPQIRIRDYTADNRGALVALYRNAAANLDRRIAELGALIEARRGRDNVVTIVMADHGESLFDDGLLGHGTALTDVQTRVPCVIVNGWGIVPVPFGQTDVRPFILSMLATERPKSSVADEPLLTHSVGSGPGTARAALQTRAAERPIFQWVGSSKTPHQLGLVTGGERTVVDFGLQTCTDVTGVGPLDSVGEGSRGLDAIRAWESLRLTEKQR